MDLVLKDAKGILDELQAYKGAGVEIREVCPPHPPSSVAFPEPFLSFPPPCRPSRTPTTRPYRTRPGRRWFPWWES